MKKWNGADNFTDMKYRATPPLHWLKAFEVSSRTLSFTRAAEELLITQSAVSKQIKNLEYYLGHKLFHRRSGGLQLTEAGLNYLPTIALGFSALEQGTRSFLNSSGQVDLKIKSNYAFASLWLCRHIGEFMDLNPRIRCTISPALWEQDFLVGDADIEIHYSKHDLLPDSAIKLTSELLVPVCAPSIFSRIRSIDDFDAECILDLTGIGDNWDYWLSQNGFDNLKLLRRHYFGTFVLSINMALEGRGITLAHSTLISRYAEKGLLVPFWDHTVSSQNNYFAVVRNERSDAARLLIDWLNTKLVS